MCFYSFYFFIIIISHLFKILFVQINKDIYYVLLFCDNIFK